MKPVTTCHSRRGSHSASLHHSLAPHFLFLFFPIIHWLSFLTAALETAVCCIMCMHLAQTGLHANIHCNSHWYGLLLNSRSTKPLPSDILLLSRVRLILQLHRASWKQVCASSWLQHMSLPSMSATLSLSRLDLCACSLQTALLPPLLSVS